jgi:hypothetical protein
VVGFSFLPVSFNPSLYSACCPCYSPGLPTLSTGHSPPFLPSVSQDGKHPLKGQKASFFFTLPHGPIGSLRAPTPYHFFPPWLTVLVACGILLSFLSDSEDGGNTCLQNKGKLLPDYTGISVSI